MGQAVKISELEAQHKTLEKEGIVKRQKAEIQKDVSQLRAEAEYIVIAKKAEASKLKALAEAEAQAEAVKLLSDAEIEVYTKSLPSLKHRWSLKPWLSRELSKLLTSLIFLQFFNGKVGCLKTCLLLLQVQNCKKPRYEY